MSAHRITSSSRLELELIDKVAFTTGSPTSLKGDIA